MAIAHVGGEQSACAGPESPLTCYISRHWLQDGPGSNEMELPQGEGNRVAGSSWPTPSELPPRAPIREGVKRVRVLARSDVPQNQVRTVSLFYSQGGERLCRDVAVRRPTFYEQVVISVVDEVVDHPRDEAFRPASFRGTARAALRGMRLALGRWSPPLRCPHPILDLRAIEPNNVAHLLLDIVPLVLFVRSVLGPEVRCVLRDARGPYRDLLELFEIAPISTSRRVAGEIVHVRGTRGLAVYDVQGTFDCPGIVFLPNVYETWSPANSWKVDKVFLARRGPRALLNQGEVERCLSGAGYETLYMEDFSVAQQLAIASQARHVVAVHGAAVATLVVNRAIESVVELLPPHVYHQLFPMCLGARVRRYALLLPEFDEAVAHSGWSAVHQYKSAPFRVDLPSLECALSVVRG